MVLKLDAVMKRFYGRAVEEGMINFYDSLSEKDRRRYAAIEALKLPHGGHAYICKLLGCDNKTIQQGISDLDREEELKKSE
jgi:hypothetical protein